MKKSNQELIQQRNNDSELECIKCNKGLSWLWALVVFVNFSFLAVIFHVVWNIDIGNLQDSHNTTARKLEEISTKLASLNDLNLNKVEQVVKDQEVELLEKAANKYHVALYAYRILKKHDQDEDASSEINELAKFESFIDTNSNLQTLKTADFLVFSKAKIKAALDVFESELNKDSAQDESWLGNVKKRIGSLVKIEHKEQVEKNKAIKEHLKNAISMLEVNDIKKALDAIKAIDDERLNSVQTMLEERIKVSSAVNQILEEAL